MEALPIIEKTREYLDYVEEHIRNVEKAWKELQAACKDMRFIYDDFFFHHLDAHVARHDLSKMSEYEFVQYRKAFYPTDKEPKYDMSAAWENHKACNPHHWETWTNMQPEIHVDDWEIHCAHMVIDWMAMGYKFGDTAQEYYEKNKHKIDLPEVAISFVYEIFRRIGPNKRLEPTPNSGAAQA